MQNERKIGGFRGLGGRILILDQYAERIVITNHHTKFIPSATKMINPYKSIRAGVKLSLMMILTLKPLGQALVGRPGKKSAKYSPDAQCEKLSADNDVVGVIVGVVGVIV